MASTTQSRKIESNEMVNLDGPPGQNLLKSCVSTHS